MGKKRSRLIIMLPVMVVPMPGFLVIQLPKKAVTPEAVTS